MSDEKNKGGRPTTFTEEIAHRICNELAEGKSLKRVCSADDMPHMSVVFGWMHRNPWFKELYAAAREQQAQHFAEEIIEIADDGTNDYMDRVAKDGSITPAVDSEHIQRSRLRVDTRKWLVSKILPKQYGDRVALEHTGKDGGPVQIQKIVREVADPEEGDDEDRANDLSD